MRPIGTDETMCPVCERSAIGGATHPNCFTKYSLDGLTSFFHYDGPVQKAIKAIKYRFVWDLAGEFISLVPSVHLPNGIVIPIPLHPARLKYRGFNQAEKLGKLLQISMRNDILRRTTATTPQVSLNDRKKRLENMYNVFAARKTNEQILLFDDVFTTGATMRSAAAALKRAGAPFVWAVTIAR